MPEIDVPFTAGEEASRVSALEQFQRDLSERGVKNWGKITDSAVAYAQQSVTDTMHAQKERVLERAQDLIKDALEGKRYAGQAEFVAEMRKVLGFPTSGNFGEKGNLNNLAGDRRLRMIYDMQMTRAHAEIKAQEDKESGADVLFPAQELVRGASVKEPRDWIARWQEAGGTFYDGRMMALKDDGIWTRISAFGEPYPPFDYNSQMVVRDVSIREAIDVGLLPENALEDALKDYERINADEEPEPEPQETPQELVERAETTQKATSAEWTVEERINAERKRFLDGNLSKITATDYVEQLATPQARYVLEHYGADALTVDQGEIAMKAGVRDATVNIGTRASPNWEKFLDGNCTACATASDCISRGLPVKARRYKELISKQNAELSDRFRSYLPATKPGKTVFQRIPGKGHWTTWEHEYVPRAVKCNAAKNIYFGANAIPLLEKECVDFKKLIKTRNLADGRYQMIIMYKKVHYGHITTFTIKNGVPTFFEPQTGELQKPLKYKGTEHDFPYTGVLRWRNGGDFCPVTIFRVDDRPISLRAINYFTEMAI